MIEALVKMNDDIGVVMKEPLKLRFYRLNNLIYGTDGPFYACYYYEEPFGRFNAFGGRKFKITLDSGEIIECCGQWWDGGYGNLSKHLGIELKYCPVSSIPELKDCYVYFGMKADINKLSELILGYKGSIYEYRDYEKVLKYDDLRDKYFNFQLKSEKAKKHLIRKVKQFSKMINQ
jgi:hypothetical protein